MKLTKHIHACVALDSDTVHILIDPSEFEPDVKGLISQYPTILFTHIHSDHIDVKATNEALSQRDDLTIYGPPQVLEQLDAGKGKLVAVKDGDSFDVDGVTINVYGETHAPIHEDMPQDQNVGYVIDGNVYHPGDSYFVPDTSVKTLLVPTSGPWAKTGETVDFVRAVHADRTIQIHESMLSDMGQQYHAMLLSPDKLTDTQLTILKPGESIDV